MKKFLALCLSLCMVLSCGAVVPAFAAESEAVVEATAFSDASDSGIMPCGALSGYGQHWYNSGESTVGSFDVVVTGTSWISAQITLKMEDFGPYDQAYLVVYKPDGSVAWKCSSYASVEYNSYLENLSFSGAPTGTYRVTYSLRNIDTGVVGSGRINCWIY